MSRLPALLLIAIAFAPLIGCGKRPQPVAAPGATGTVTMEIDFGDHSESIRIDGVESGTTLEAVMRSIDQLPISIRGSGVTAFVDGIGNVSTNSSEGWTFQVDGEFANQGIGSTTLSPPTTIRWSFGDASEIVE